MRLLGAWPARLALGIKERFRANLKGEWSPSAGITPARAPWRLFTTHRSSLVPQSGGAAQQRRPAVLALARASSHARSTTVAPEVQGYWQELLDGVDKPTARKLVDFVDPAYPLGLAPAAEAGPVPGTARGRRKNPPVFFYFLETKRQHPTKVVLVRVGEFFEAVGIDAVLLVQHAGLNPMGAGNPPRAGCPRQNLRRTVADLVHAGLSVVVCEEVSEGYSYGYRRVNAKERYVAQVLTPATPHLLYGLVDEGTDVAFDSTPPLLGISMQVGGFMVVEVNVELFKVTVTQGLTEDAVHARLYEGGLSPPLFIHVPGGVGGREVSTALAPWERRVATAFRSQAGSVERFTGADPVEGLVQRVRQLLSIPPDAKFTVVSSSVTDQPRPLYLSTAANLGLHSSRGVPPLLDYLLPPSTPSAARAWLCQLLLIPPPPSVGAAVLQACRQLSGVEVGVPIFPSLGVANVVLKLTQHEANDVFFRELASLCHSVGEACSCSDLEDFSDAVLAAACHSSGLSYPREELARACSEAFDAIGAVVEAEERLTGSGSSSLDEDEVPMLPGEPAHDALRRFQQANEGRFRGRVQNRCIPQQHQAVEAAWEEVEATAVDMMARVSAALGQGGGSANGARQVASARASQPCLAHNSVNNAVWLKVPRAAAAVHILKELGLGHPKDRMGNAEQGYYATREAEVAQDAYRRACAEAAEAVKAQLRRLAGKLQAHLSHLVTATMFATIATALVAHVSESRRRGWVLPQQRYPRDYLPGAALHEEGQGAAGAGALDVRGMWPYWLDGASEQVVRNDVSMQGMFLLTGPNMAGKSTLLRSLCAVSLLAACGLAVPASAAAVPYIDAFMLRNFSADSPVDGRSSFAVEMTEMRYVLGDVTPSSLVLVDELGKGTEVRAGAALAGAMLEQLASIACKGIFATHLHALLDMDLRLPGVELRCMEVERRPRQRRPQGAVIEAEELGDGLSPTWRMVPGSSRESLALEVASACEVPAPVLRRAAELYHGMQVVTYTQGLPASTQRQEQEGAQGEDGRGGSQAVAAVETAAAQSQGGSTGGLQSLQEAGEVLQRTAAQVLANLLRTQEQEGSQAARPVVAVAAAASAGSTDQWCQTAVLGSSGSAASTTAEAAAVEAPGSGTHPELQVHYVRKGQDPPPRTVGCACVYVVRREDGCFYVGSTDVLRQRIAAHRRRKPSSSSRVGGGPGIEVAYVLFLGDVGGASTARVVEAAAIQALQQQGFPLLSVADAQRRHVPRFS